MPFPATRLLSLVFANVFAPIMMKLTQPSPSLRKPFAPRAFSIMEVLVATLLVSVIFLSLYAGISAGLGMVQLSRENLRATQILQEKMETIRLYNWDQINQQGFVPATFTAPFYGTNVNSPDAGIIYQGSLSISNAPVSESYSGDLRMVTAVVRWTSGNVERNREMSTFVSRYGLQNYIY
jgi:Tfp pilus assembly protein PilV